MDYTSSRAQSEGLLDRFKQFLNNLAAIVPGAYVKRSTSVVATQDGKCIKVGALLADETRADGWLHAITEFQAAVTSLQGE